MPLLSRDSAPPGFRPPIRIAVPCGEWAHSVAARVQLEPATVVANHPVIAHRAFCLQAKDLIQFADAGFSFVIVLRLGRRPDRLFFPNAASPVPVASIKEFSTEESATE